MPEDSSGLAHGRRADRRPVRIPAPWPRFRSPAPPRCPAGTTEWIPSSARTTTRRSNAETAMRIPVRSRVVKTECTRNASRARCCSRRSSRAGPAQPAPERGDDPRRQRAGEQPAGHDQQHPGGPGDPERANWSIAAATAAAANPAECRALPEGDLVVVRARQRERHDLAAGMAFGLRHRGADRGGLFAAVMPGRKVARGRCLHGTDSSALRPAGGPAWRRAIAATSLTGIGAVPRLDRPDSGLPYPCPVESSPSCCSPSVSPVHWPRRRPPRSSSSWRSATASPKATATPRAWVAATRAASSAGCVRRATTPSSRTTEWAARRRRAGSRESTPCWPAAATTSSSWRARTTSPGARASRPIAFNLDEMAARAEALDIIVVHATVIPRIPTAPADASNAATSALAQRLRDDGRGVPPGRGRPVHPLRGPARRLRELLLLRSGGRSTSSGTRTPTATSRSRASSSRPCCRCSTLPSSRSFRRPGPVGAGQLAAFGVDGAADRTVRARRMGLRRRRLRRALRRPTI